MEDNKLLYDVVIKLLRYSNNEDSIDGKKELLREIAISNIIEELLQEKKYQEIDNIVGELDIDHIVINKMSNKDIVKLFNENKDNDYYLGLSSFLPILPITDLYILYNCLVSKNKYYVYKK